MTTEEAREAAEHVFVYGADRSWGDCVDCGAEGIGFLHDRPVLTEETKRSIDLAYLTWAIPRVNTFPMEES